VLNLNKETLTELTADDLTSVVGGITCVIGSCVTGISQPTFCSGFFTQGHETLTCEPGS